MQTSSSARFWAGAATHAGVQPAQNDELVGRLSALERSLGRVLRALALGARQSDARFLLHVLTVVDKRRREMPRLVRDKQFAHPAVRMAARVFDGGRVPSMAPLLATSIALSSDELEVLAEAVRPLFPLRVSSVEVLSEREAVVVGESPNDCWRVVLGVEAEAPHGLTDIDFHRCREVVDWEAVATSEAVEVRGTDLPIARSLAEELTAIRDDWRIAGLTASLATADGGAQFCGGVADPWLGTRMTFETPLRLASQIKGWTAAAALSLVADGLLDLDQPVGALVPVELPGGITLRHLLTHTSGLDSRWPGRIHDGVPATARAARVLLQSGLRSVAEPGTVFAYSNIGFGVVGLLLEELTGMPAAKFTIDAVGHPIGARSLTFDEWPDGTTGTALEGGAIVPPPRVFPLLLSAGGGWATADDALRLADNLLPNGPGALPEEVVRLLTTDQTPSGTGDRSAGLARYRDATGARWVGHVGGWPGFSGAFAACPDRNIAVSVLLNQSAPARFELPKRLIGALT